MSRLTGSQGSRSTDSGDPIRASEQERALCRALLQTYGELYQLALGHRHDHLAAHVERTETLLEELRRVASVVGPVRRHAQENKPPADGSLAEIWADTAISLAEIVPLRARVVTALRAAADETRKVLVRVGAGQQALGAYRALERSSACRRSQRA